MSIALKMLAENANTFAERNAVYSLTENEVSAVNNTMIANLYQSAIDRSHVDFDTIPDSEGDITKYTGYSSLTTALSVIKDISAKTGVAIPEVEVITQAVQNITTYREQFHKGFRLRKEFIILQYNALVFACVEATSAIISSYVDFIKRPDRVEFQLIKGRERNGIITVDILNQFNLAVKKGEFSKALNAVISTGSESLIGAGTAAVTVAVVGSLLSIVPLTREIIFLTYYSRMKLSDYLEQQAALIEVHKETVAASNAPARERNNIVKKQDKYIQQLRRLSDKIKVDRVSSERDAKVEMKKENKTWSLDTVQAQAASTDSGGFQLL